MEQMLSFLGPVNDWLVDTFGTLGPLYGIGFLGLALILLTLPSFLARPEDPLDRLKRQASETKTDQNGEEKQRLRHAGGSKKLDKFANFLEPQDEEEFSASRMTLLRAGYRTKSAVRTYHFAQFALGLIFLAAGVLYAVITSATGEISTQKMILSIIIPGGVGYYLPKYWVNRRVQEREVQITEGFPDSLDMLLVCVEAGQSLEQAILRVSKELQAGYPALAEELELVSHELKAGKDKVTVLKDFGERAGVTDVSSFVTVLIQSASFGTSIADALRVYAAEMRDKRVMRAEEKANVLPTKLTLGTMMFTVPPLMIILIGPSVYSIYTQLNGANF
ncbi:MAG: type II secretion system F family protein [Oceanicola sp.]|nr:type II secretion system F family protein [Oceanicola sp.]